MIPKKERYSGQEVDYLFAGLNLIDDRLSVILAESISNLPRRVVDWTAEKVLFVSSDYGAVAFAFNKKDWRSRLGFIFITEGFGKETQRMQTFIIAHEIAHLKLGHFNPILDDLTDEQEKVQEQAADDLALKWLGNDFRTEWTLCSEGRKNLTNISEDVSP
jgi:Zn-dependent peptidase ImmA (M78 family)